jgi:hypothetical protein
MTPRRALLACCLTTLAALACTPAGARDDVPAVGTATAPPDPRAADDAGLLVALAADGDGQDTATATLLLDWRDGTPRLGAATPGILVPHADGFRWVGSVTRCTHDEGGDAWVIRDAFLYSDQALWAARPGDTVRVRLAGEPCTSLAHALYLARLDVKRVRDSLDAASPDSLRALDEASEVTEQPVDFGDYCSVGTHTIGFVSDTLLAYEDRQQTTEFCSPDRYATWGHDVVRRLDAPEGADSVGLNALLPPHVRDSLLAVFTGELDCVTDADSTGLDHHWAMRHVDGAWQLTAWFDGATVCRGGQDFLLDVPPPASLVRDTRLAAPWDSLARRTGARDAATSPSGRWTMLVRGDSVLVARVTATNAAMHVDSAALVVPVPAGARRVVMLRWLGTREVARLRRTMPAVRRPVVVVVPPPAP